MPMTFRVELVWQDDETEGGDRPCSIYLTKDGRVVLQGAAVSDADRIALDLPRDVALVSVDRKLINAIKEML